MAKRAAFPLPLLILAGVLLTIFHRLLLGEAFFWGLPSLQFYPWREYAFDLLRDGQLPLWNSYNGAGAPLLANYQSALLYPLNWLGLIFPLAWWMSITSVLHLFIAGVGMWALTGRLGLPSLGRGISVLAFALTSYLVGRLGTYPTISTAAWMPWVLWATLGLLSCASRRDTGWLAVFVALQLLAGHAQTTWYSMLLVAAFCGWWSITHHPFNGRRLAIVIAGLALGAGIAAIQLLPTAELLRQSQRSSGVDYDFAMNYSYAPLRSFNFLLPNFFGNPADGSYVTNEKGETIGVFFEDAVYIGLIPVISALVAILTWLWRKVRRTERPVYFATVPFWLLIVIIGFIFALGKHSPIFPFLYRNIPTFSLFQAPVRWHIWTVFGLSILAGIGAGVWGRGYWLFFGTRLATAAAVGAALLAFAAPRFLPPDVTDNEGVRAIINAVIITGVLGALAGVLTLTQPHSQTSTRYRWWTIAVLLVIGVDFAYAAWGLNPTVPASFYDRRSSNTDYTRAYWPEDAEEKVKYQAFLQFNDYRVATNNLEAYRSSNLSNLNLLDRNALLNNFEPLLVGGFAGYVGLIEANPAVRDTLLQAAGVNLVYDEQGELETLAMPASRAWVVEYACWHADETSLANALIDPAWNPLLQVHLLGEGDCPPVSDSAEPMVTLTVTGQTEPLITIPADRNGWLVLADTFYPGWAAKSVDGIVEYPIQRANLAFRAIEVEGGESIHFSYQPGWLLPGALISVISLLLMLVLFRSKNPD